MGKAPAPKNSGAKISTARRREKPAEVDIAGDARASANALDLENYVPAFLTWIANKLSSSASLIYRRRFGVGIVEWRIMALLAVEPWITAGPHLRSHRPGQSRRQPQPALSRAKTAGRNPLSRQQQ